jgi:hypothetical protein
MTLINQIATKVIFLFSILFCAFSLSAQTTQVGSGSYTNTFPGTDSAGRNGYPSGAPQLSGNANPLKNRLEIISKRFFCFL